MDKLDELKMINKAKIEYLRFKGEDVTLNEYIAKIFDDKDFLKSMPKDDTMNLLKTLDLNNTDLEEIYELLLKE